MDAGKAVNIQQPVNIQRAASIQQTMDIQEKLAILADAAKYDVACTSSGVDRRNGRRGTGSAAAAGICHSFAGDGALYLSA